MASCGKFGERWAELCDAYGAQTTHWETEWVRKVDPAELDRQLDESEGVEVVFTTLSETSTGVVNDVRALTEVTHRHGALIAVDAVSAMGAIPLPQDEWGVDVVVSGSQKALMAPPGLATAAVSAAAWERVAGAALPRFYLDWERTRKAQQKLDSAFTPAVSLVVALDVALGLLLEGGLDAAFERHVRLGRACRAGIKAMGLELFSPDEDRSAVVTAARMPEGMDSTDLTLALRERHGVTIAGGQGELKGAIFRIGHIGWYDEFDIATALSAVELVLGELGAPIERGVAASRALEVYAEGTPV